MCVCRALALVNVCLPIVSVLSGIQKPINRFFFASSCHTTGMVAYPKIHCFPQLIYDSIFVATLCLSERETERERALTTADIFISASKLANNFGFSFTCFSFLVFFFFSINDDSLLRCFINVVLVSQRRERQKRKKHRKMPKCS